MFSAVMLALIAVPAVLAAPHVQGYKEDPNSRASNEPCQNENGTETEVYDQRQNGTENYRIDVNGLFVLLAPAETLLAATNLPNVEDEHFKPPKVPTTQETVDDCDGGKCNLTNSTVRQKGKVKMNILQLFRNLKHELQPATH